MGGGVRKFLLSILTSRSSPHSDIVLSSDLVHFLQGGAEGGKGKGVKEYPSILTPCSSTHPHIVVSTDLVHFLQGWGRGAGLSRLGVGVFHHIIIWHLSLILRHIWVWLTSA